jgi:hypothetical protein
MEIADAGIGQILSVGLSGRGAEYHTVTDVALHLPHIAGMCFGNVDDKEFDPSPILLCEFVERGNLPAKRRSGIASEDQHYGPLISEVGKSYGSRVVETREGEIGCGIAGLESTGPRGFPERLERKSEERDWAEMRHETRNAIGGLAHNRCQHAQSGDPEKY